MDPFVAVNGEIFSDADAYLFVKNKGGKVRVYKENLYRPLDESRFIASRTDKSRYYIGELNGRSAKDVYKEYLNSARAILLPRPSRIPSERLRVRISVSFLLRRFPEAVSAATVR